MKVKVKVYNGIKYEEASEKIEKLSTKQAALK